MVRFLLCLSLIFSCTVAFCEKPAGFLWYNLPKADSLHQKPKPGSVAFSKLSYTDRDAVLSFYTMEALHKVRFTHDIEDERVFLALQDFWLKEASLHGRLNQLALIKYPQYDFSVTHPTSDIGLKLRDSIERDHTIAKIKNLAKSEGLLFFYRAENPYDQKQIPILKNFCEQYHFTLIPLSVDGVNSTELPNSRIDKGQADYLKVRYFPAILLVNPKTQITHPIAYGITTQDDLIQRLIAVTTPIKGVEA